MRSVKEIQEHRL